MAVQNDFSNLPDVVWVNVLSRLPLSDRNSVARTCIRLYDVFHHPSLWHTLKIVLLADLVQHDNRVVPSRLSRLSHGVIVPERYVDMIKTFGAFFQDLHLIIIGHVNKMEHSVEQVLSQLAESCRLESLSLEIGNPVNLSNAQNPPSTSALEIIGKLIGLAFRMKSLKLLSWPVYENRSGYDILRCMTDNVKIVDLQKLNLFHKEASPDAWFSLNLSLPQPEEVLRTVTHFTQLQSLSICSTLMTEELMVELSSSKNRSRPLTHLAILMLKTTKPILRIRNSTWKNLKARCPLFQVDITLANTVPPSEFLEFFQSELRLNSITFCKYCRYECHILDHLSANYTNTLTKFVDYSDGVDSSFNDDDFVSFVTRCKQLNWLTFSGRLADSTILKVAELHGKNWNVLQLKIQSHPLSENNEDEDKVIGVAGNGNYCINAHSITSGFYHTENSEQLRAERIEKIIETVSCLLQQKWSPTAILPPF